MLALLSKKIFAGAVDGSVAMDMIWLAGQPAWFEIKRNARMTAEDRKSG